MSTQLDEMLAEGKHPAGSFENTEIAAVRNRCRIGQVSLYGGALAEFGVRKIIFGGERKGCSVFATRSFEPP